MKMSGKEVRTLYNITAKTLVSVNSLSDQPDEQNLVC